MDKHITESDFTSVLADEYPIHITAVPLSIERSDLEFHTEAFMGEVKGMAAALGAIVRLAGEDSDIGLLANDALNRAHELHDAIDVFREHAVAN
jgi:hypothetical protein